MADADKNILITPNRGSTTADPKIEFTGGDNNTVTLTTLDDGTLSISGSAGQLFSISDSLTGTIFSVNDVSGIPSIEVDDDGTVRLAEFAGNVLIGTDTDSGAKLQVNGDVSFGNGSGTVVAWMGNDGDLWKGSADNSGSKYYHAGDFNYGSNPGTGTESEVFGLGAQGGGTLSTAFGNNAQALSVGSFNVSIGGDSTAYDRGTTVGVGASSGSSGVAIGNDALTGASSTSIGRSASTVSNSVAVGNYSSAQSQGVAFGNNAIGNQQGVAVGTSSSANGVGGVAIGYGTVADGTNSIVIGTSSVDSVYDNCMLLGAGTATVNTAGTAIIGNTSHQIIKLFGSDSSNANAGQVLGWNGTSMEWVDQAAGDPGGGGGGIPQPTGFAFWSNSFNFGSTDMAFNFANQTDADAFKAYWVDVYNNMGNPLVTWETNYQGNNVILEINMAFNNPIGWSTSPMDVYTSGSTVNVQNWFYGGSNSGLMETL